MQHLIERLYTGDLKDLRKTVSRFEYEQRETRNKLDIATLYVEVKAVKDALGEAGITVERKDPAQLDEDLVLVVKEDRKNMDEELAEAIHTQYLLDKEKKGFLPSIKRWGTKNLYVKSRINKSVSQLIKEYGEPDLAKEVNDIIRETKTSTTVDALEEMMGTK